MQVDSISGKMQMEEDLGGAYSAPGAAGHGDESPCLAPGSTPGVTISYQLHGTGATKLLLIPGLACGHGFWRPFVRELTSSSTSSSDWADEEEEEQIDERRSNLLDDGEVEICTFDNRGVGSSSIPTQKSDYSTTIMAMDALSLLDFLGWKQAHVCGHSMGAMIAFKMAATASHRVLSLTLISITGGGFHCFPKMEWKSFSLAYRFFRAKSLEQRVLVDLDMHYSRDYLNATIRGVPRKNLLFKEYLKNMKGGMQPKAGLNGHIHACWSHEAKTSDYEQIRGAIFPVAVIHGIDDVIAQIRHGRFVAKRLGNSARFWTLAGGHLVTHESTEEALEILMRAIRSSLSEWRQTEASLDGGAEISCHGRAKFFEEAEYHGQDPGIWKKIQRLICGCLCLIAVALWFFNILLL